MKLPEGIPPDAAGQSLPERRERGASAPTSFRYSVRRLQMETTKEAEEEVIAAAGLDAPEPSGEQPAPSPKSPA